MIRNFKGRRTRRVFEGERVREFQSFSDQATRRLTILDSAESLRDLVQLRSNRLVKGLASTVSELTANGESVSVGSRMDPTT